jgi:hypothetical protein
LACGGSANGDKWAIEQTIRGYFSTYNACNYEECLTYFTDYGDKEDALSQLAAFRGLSGELTLVRIGGITIENSTATAEVIGTMHGQTDSQSMTLRREGGRWKILWEQ